MIVKRVIALSALLLCGTASAYNFPCLPNIAGNGEKGTNLRWSININGPSYVAWTCPGVVGPVFVASDYWPFDLTTTVTMANKLGWPAIKMMAAYLPNAASVAPQATAAAVAVN